MKKNKHPIPGTVYRIPLPNGMCAIARQYLDASVGVYARIFDQPPPLAEIAHLPIAFVTGCFLTAIKDGTWKAIGHIPFESNDAAWGPPQYVQDFINPKKFRIYHRGEMRPAHPDEVNGLERAQMFKPEQLVSRILEELSPKNDSTGEIKGVRRL